MRFEAQLSISADAFDHADEASGGEWRSAAVAGLLDVACNVHWLHGVDRHYASALAPSQEFLCSLSVGAPPKGVSNCHYSREIRSNNILTIEGVWTELRVRTFMRSNWTNS